MALDLRMKNGFRAISFEYVGVLDSYFIFRYVIIKYRSSLITNKIHRLLLELWPLVNGNALFMRIWQQRGHPCPMDTFLVHFNIDQLADISINPASPSPLVCHLFIFFSKSTFSKNTFEKYHQSTGASPVFTICHKVISSYSLFQYIIVDGILLSWTDPCVPECLWSHKMSGLIWVRIIVRKSYQQKTLGDKKVAYS